MQDKKTTAKKTKPTRKKVIPLPPMKISKGLWNKDKVMSYIYEQTMLTTHGLQTILESAPYEMPNKSLVLAWQAESKEIQDQYARAREARAELLEEQLLEIADNIGSPVMIDGIPLMVDGKLIMAVSPTDVSQAKLQVETRKWIMSHLKPKKYGETAAKTENNVFVGGGEGKSMVNVQVNFVAADKRQERVIEHD